jgi:hypothetical protein|tara:strand:- start:3774 stop:4145 length:372 start_codon:yes stop_codon:yes gene_type:complete
MAHRISNQKLEELIVQHKGFVTRICKSAGISRQAFYSRLENHPKLKRKLDESRDEIIDFAESKLIELINEKHYPSIRFYLETQGKDKGYTIKTEVDNKHTIQNILEVPEMSAYEPTIDEIKEH